MGDRVDRLRRLLSGERDGMGLQERVERSELGRGVISGVLVLTLAAVLATNLPPSEVRDGLTKTAGPYLTAIGLDQNWGVFAPDPRPESVLVEARVEYADGGTSVWRVPRARGFAELHDYRWQKYGENVRLDDRQALWRPLAEYVARDARRGGRQPVKVTLVRRWSPILPPGPGPGSEPWREYAYFTFTPPEGES